VFPKAATQRQVYERAVQSVVDQVSSGMNGAVFTYGQHATGKTYTMQGKCDDVCNGVECETAESDVGKCWSGRSVFPAYPWGLLKRNGE
jgi:hypothetical protein